VEDQIAEGDKVVVRYRFRDTHLGAFQGMPPTGKQVAYTGILIYRIADGKIAEQGTEFDLLGFLRQPGILPTASKEPSACV
jgi:predicted ester cyclase